MNLVGEYCRVAPPAWSESRSCQVVAKVERHPGKLYPRVGFLVTNLRRPARKVVAFYKGGRLLQRARDSRAMDQGGQERGQMDAALVHHLPGQRRPAPCAGVQSRQLPPG